jgi:hypothetical protein
MTTNIPDKELHIFENSFKELGNALDDFFNNISINPTNKINSDEMVIDNDNIIVRNEILSVFNKSKLNPDQFATLLVTNNIYIENEKPGDWSILKKNEVEENIYNIKHELDNLDKDANNKSVQYKTNIRQTFGEK